MLYLFAGMVLTPLVINWIASRHDFARYADAFALSTMIVVFWCITNMMGMLLEPPASKALHPLIDFFEGASCMWLYRHDKAKWKAALAVLFFAQCGLHAWFWYEHLFSPNTRVYRSYQFAVNVSWAAEVFLLTLTGGGLVSRLALDWLRSRTWIHHHPGVAR